MTASRSCTFAGPIRGSWGCDFCESPDTPAADAHLFWAESCDRSLLSIEAHAIPVDHPAAIDFRALPIRASLLVDGVGQEHWVGRKRGSHVSLRVCRGTLLAGPVLLHIRLDGRDRTGAQLAAIGRLFALLRGDPVPPDPPLPASRLRRLQAGLQALDAIEVGASYREVAILLFGEAEVSDRWRGDSDYLRLRVQRLVRDARALCATGYAGLLA